MEAGDERLLHSGSPALGQIEVVVVAAHVVGVPADREFPVSVLLEDLRNFVEHRLRLRLDMIAGEIEVDAVDLDFLFSARSLSILCVSILFGSTG